MEKENMAYTIGADLSIRTISDEIFILKRSASTIHSFNYTGTFIWSLLQARASFPDIVKAVMGRYDVDREMAEEDISTFFFTLEKNGLITISPK
jgi:hypothetical protein